MAILKKCPLLDQIKKIYVIVTIDTFFDSFWVILYKSGLWNAKFRGKITLGNTNETSNLIKNFG